jgi:integrase
MGVVKRKGSFYLYFRPFKDKKIGVRVDCKSAAKAEDIEKALLRACRSGDYQGLDPESREACVRMFVNQKWELPPELAAYGAQIKPREELTLWKAVQLFYAYPEIKASPSKWRHECAALNLTLKLGKDTPLKEIWVPHLKQYRIERLKEGAAEGTVNRELATLSKVFRIMVELQLVDSNPLRLVPRLSTKSGERQVYLSFQDVQKIMDQCPAWFRPLVLTAYYTGMRSGEIRELTRKQVNLAKRMITLSPDDTKEAYWKRVPIHKDLVPILEESLKVTSLGTDKVFLWQGKRGVRKLELETFKNPWPRACEKLQNEDPENPYFKGELPRFHDLRHTWKTNARRSGMDSEIRESILGHASKARSVSERYGRISDAELLQAIDLMTFDHGDTEILVARSKPVTFVGNKMETSRGSRRKKATLSSDPVSMMSSG